MLTILRKEGEALLSSQDAAEIPALLASKEKLFWLDLESPTPDEFDLLQHVFQFHPLAVEDAMKPHQRPKVDEFEGYFFLTADEVTLDLDRRKPSHSRPQDEGDAVQARQMSAFLGCNYLVTIHVEPVHAIRNLRDRCSHNHNVLGRGPDYLLYTMLDVLVDGYFPLLDALDDVIDDLEDRIIDNPQKDVLETIFGLKRDLTHLRKFAGPLREVVQTLTTRDFPHIQAKTLPYFRDVTDHLFRIYETLDSYRDLMSNMLDAYLSQVSNQMNRVMQKLSIVATIFLPITFITGVFGMNFEPQPWLHTNAWFWMFMMLVIAVLTYVWFRKRHWT